MSKYYNSFQVSISIFFKKNKHDKKCNFIFHAAHEFQYSSFSVWRTHEVLKASLNTLYMHVECTNEA